MTSSQDQQSNSPSLQSEAEESIVSPLTVAAIAKKKTTFRPKKVIVFKQCKQFPQDVLDLEQEINSTPMTYSNAVKTNNCVALTTVNNCKPHLNSKYHNKPFIRGRINNFNNSSATCFMDSGAEVNCIDSNFLKSLKLPTCFKVENCDSHNIKCANNSRLSVSGKIVLPVSIGVTTKSLTFFVISGLAPKVIIGLRGLKTLDVVLCPAKDSLKCSGIEIPFLGKTFCESKHQKNEQVVH